ncbi:hypothetical protein BgiMline_016154 [Biomphalaria glabrata]|uniref:Uncharacterized protein LOC106070671 n=1 Tax=Biomphalaria glabrata TaxID=6526 RepID=A0A2C9KU62_BIOGL|nr:uncharacterized protein LOC106070671 [Biomphalaria glabrata]XP_055890097.1 uncharacterized protein LOC106070671 [Biomphalaria glabrata]KAI8758330.1 prokineticin receptor 2-like [Biomphalaria glabrata]KAI8791841.1 prokineticin receptor 2 [Biomphalaria glabrata]
MTGYNTMDSHYSNHFTNENNSNHVHSETAEGALLFTVAFVGGLGNIIAMIATLVCPTFRQMSSAFLFHHCLLDAVKSVFCIPFGYSLLMNQDIPHCHVLGAGYILLMTVSAYNLLALLVNEEYQCSFSTARSYHQSSDGCCIAFGVVIIWFSTVLLHLGVAFLPGTSEYNKEVGNCVYKYGITKNYVIHALWVILVTGAVLIAAVSFIHFYRKLRSSAKCRKWTFLHKSLSSLSPHNTMHTDQSEEVHYEFDDLASQKALLQSKRYLRRISIMMGMLISFVLCWYPLFFLTLLDVNYQQPPHIYRLLMIVAWTHPVTTPIFCAIIYYDTAKGEQVSKDIYTNALPMSTSRSGVAICQEINNLHRASVVIGFHNDNFQSTPNHDQSRKDNYSVHHDELDLPCDTIINYNSEGGCQTLIL